MKKKAILHILLLALLSAALLFITRSWWMSLGILMLILLILTAIGRVLANQHWVSDVIGGLVFAAVFIVIYYLIIRRPQHA